LKEEGSVRQKRKEDTIGKRYPASPGASGRRTEPWGEKGKNFPNTTRHIKVGRKRSLAEKKGKEGIPK